MPSIETCKQFSLSGGKTLKSWDTWGDQSFLLLSDIFAMVLNNWNIYSPFTESRSSPSAGDDTCSLEKYFAIMMRQKIVVNCFEGLRLSWLWLLNEHCNDTAGRERRFALETFLPSDQWPGPGRTLSDLKALSLWDDRNYGGAHYHGKSGPTLLITSSHYCYSPPALPLPLKALCLSTHK